MFESINDIRQVIANLNKEMQLMGKEMNRLQNEISQLTRNSEAQLHGIRSLRRENAVLRDRLSRYEELPKDSRNSSTPPSKENLKFEVKRRAKSLREKSDKSVGGQKGHERSTREKSENVDERVDPISKNNQA